METAFYRSQESVTCRTGLGLSSGARVRGFPTTLPDLARSRAVRPGEGLYGSEELAGGQDPIRPLAGQGCPPGVGDGQEESGSVCLLCASKPPASPSPGHR